MSELDRQVDHKIHLLIGEERLSSPARVRWSFTRQPAIELDAKLAGEFKGKVDVQVEGLGELLKAIRKGK